MIYTESGSKVGFWLRWLCSTFFVTLAAQGGIDFWIIFFIKIG